MSGQTVSGSGYVQRIREDFTTVAWVLIPVGVGINVVGGTVVNALRLPVFMDVIGTMLVAILAGPFVGVVTGVLTNVILGVTASPTSIPYGLTNAAIALVVGFMAMRGWFGLEEAMEYWRLVAAGIIVAIVATIVSAPITVILFGGITGGPTSVVTGFFLATGQEIWSAVVSSSLVIEPFDKTISVVVAYAIARSVPERYRPERGQDALEE